MRNIERGPREPARLERRITYVEIDGVRYRKELLRRYDDNGFLAEEREILTRANDGQRVSLRLERFGFRGRRVLESVFVEYGDHSEETLREVVECKYNRQLRLEKVKYSRFLFGSKEIEIAVSHDPESGRPLELARSLYEDGHKVTEEVRRLDVEEEEFKSEGVSSDDEEEEFKSEGVSSDDEEEEFKSEGVSSDDEEEEFKSEGVSSDDSESTGVDETEEVDGIDAVNSLSGVSSRLSLADTINPPVPTSPPGKQSPPSPRRVIPSITPLIYIKYWADNQKNPRQQNDNPPPPASKLTQPPSGVPSRSNSLEPVASRDLEKKQAPKEDEELAKRKMAGADKVAVVERQLVAALVAPLLPEQILKQPDSGDEVSAANMVKDLSHPKEAHKGDEKVSLAGTEAEPRPQEEQETGKREKFDVDKLEAVDSQPTTSPPTLPKSQNPQPEAELPAGIFAAGQDDSKSGKNVWATVLVVAAVLLLLSLFLYLL